MTSKSDYVSTLYAAHEQSLLNFLTAKFRDREDAREIAQEAWLRIFRLENPQELDNPRAFIYQTASNIAIDRHRHATLASRHAEAEAAQPIDGQLAPSPEQHALNRETLDQIQQTLSELPYRCRQAFTMHRARGMSYPAIAEELGVSVSMVEKYIIKALKHFRDAT